MPYAPLNIPPGMFRNGTAYQNAGRWYDGNLVRWTDGILRPIGGWMKATETRLSGIARGIHCWRENDLERRAAIGTHTHLYIYSSGSVWDISPVDLVAGRENSISGFGYGYGVYGGGDYGEGRPPSGALDATTWSLDNWGEHLVACSSTDGRLLEWRNDVSEPAAPISGAPTNCEALIVTPERHLVAIGAGGDRRKIQWCTSENNTDWTPTSTNSAGDLTIDTKGRLIAGKRVRGQILLWTEEELHAMEYTGPPYWYGVTKVASYCGLIGPRAVEALDIGAAWMGAQQFYLFDGILRPVKCDVADYVFSDFNFEQRAKVNAGHNSRFSEIWWFYPSAASDEVDRYVLWNYRDNTWATGNLARTCWADSGVFKYPLAVDADGYIYEHECGWTANGTAITSDRFARCGPMEIGVGDNVMQVRQIIPDERTSGQARLRFYGRYTPEGTETEYGPYTLSPYTDARFTARQVGMKVEGAADADWRVGKIRLDVVAGGQR